MNGFIEFLKSHGVIGLAVAFILGAALTRLVTALVNDVINPVLAPVLGLAENLRQATVRFGTIEILWGDLLATAIDFLIIALVVYLLVKSLGVDMTKK